MESEMINQNPDQESAVTLEEQTVEESKAEEAQSKETAEEKTSDDWNESSGETEDEGEEEE